jgi:methylglutaconyl-CoA hydratase
MENITLDVQDRVGIITLNRPDKRNALSTEMVVELKKAFQQFEVDAEVKVILVKAAGQVFCSGADLFKMKEMQQEPWGVNLQDAKELEQLYRIIYTLKKVVIAQVEGHALAGGCGFATIADFCFSVPEAKFGYPEVKIGFVPSIVALFLKRKIGGRARPLLLSGDTISAEQAKHIGMIHEIVPAHEIEKHVWDYAQHLCHTNSGQAMALTKQLLYRIQSMNFGEALTYTAEQNVEARLTTDCKQGVQNFIDKKPMDW